MAPGSRLPGPDQRIVIACPSFDPLICYPLLFQAFSEAFPRTSISVVKLPGTTSHMEGVNLVFLDGNRNDMPLRDRFADHVVLEGSPAEAPGEETVSECVRITKRGGHLIIRVPVVMTEERRPAFSNLAESCRGFSMIFQTKTELSALEK